MGAVVARTAAVGGRASRLNRAARASSTTRVRRPPSTPSRTSSRSSVASDVSLSSGAVDVGKRSTGGGLNIGGGGTCAGHLVWAIEYLTVAAVSVLCLMVLVTCFNGVLRKGKYAGQFNVNVTLMVTSCVGVIGTFIQLATYVGRECRCCDRGIGFVRIFGVSTSMWPNPCVRTRHSNIFDCCQLDFLASVCYLTCVAVLSWFGLVSSSYYFNRKEALEEVTMERTGHIVIIILAFLTFIYSCVRAMCGLPEVSETSHQIMD